VLAICNYCCRHLRRGTELPGECCITLGSTFRPAIQRRVLRGSKCARKSRRYHLEGRYKLLSRVKGIFILDSDPEDEHRVVVYLEWSTSKIKAYGNKRGWVAVCELISPYRDDEIAAAGESLQDLREPYIISEDTFYNLCVDG